MDGTSLINAAKGAPVSVLNGELRVEEEDTEQVACSVVKLVARHLVPGGMACCQMPDARKCCPRAKAGATPSKSLRVSSFQSLCAPFKLSVVFFLAPSSVRCSLPQLTTMASKGKAATVAGASGITVSTAHGPRCYYSGLQECFRISDEYEIIDAKEGESYLVNKPGCLPLSVDHMEAGLRLPFLEVAKALLNRIKQIRGSADVFRAHFKLSALRSSGVDVYYAKHRTDMMHIQLSDKYSNNKGWMDRLFFVRRRVGAEWGFPTIIRSAQKDNFPILIQDEERASDSLLRAGVRNGEGYLTEFSLVWHVAAELEAGRDQETNEDFSEQIPVISHMVYEDDDIAAVVRIPSAVRVGTAKKTTIKVVSAGARPSFEEGERATRPSAVMKKRPTLLDEGTEDVDQFRARKKKRLVRAAPKQSEDGTKEEADEAQLLLRKKCKAAWSAE
ncbi:hypothetical protein Taro_013498 [Colocasia esculenta]|uniref:Uncharacterized protein n=1 Tax=Colocasia esculenta TaxID=4460 RepID=A0A843U6P5_COLES|nr:hypothetical protein [Colocasia esculenta]